jgi:two-component system, NarL family, response regulator
MRRGQAGPARGHWRLDWSATAMNTPYTGFATARAGVLHHASSIRLLVVDDHPIMREGLSAALSAQGDIAVVAEASDGDAGIEAYREHRPDVALIDLQMPGTDGLETIRAIRAFDREARLVVLTTFRGDVRIASALQVGARAYVYKNAPPRELAQTVREVHEGRYTLPPALRQEIANYYAADALSARELEVLRLASFGKANREIGAELHIGETTVKTHMSMILLKLGACDRAHAVRLALQRGFIDV